VGENTIDLLKIILIVTLSEKHIYQNTIVVLWNSQVTWTSIGDQNSKERILFSDNKTSKWAEKQAAMIILHHDKHDKVKNS
jgi:hypothetical protein